MELVGSEQLRLAGRIQYGVEPGAGGPPSYLAYSFSLPVLFSSLKPFLLDNCQVEADC